MSVAELSDRVPGAPEVREAAAASWSAELKGPAVLLGAELLVAWLHVGRGWGGVATLLAHGAVIAVAAWRLLAVAPAGRDLTRPALAVLAAAVAGPVGAMAALVMAATGRRAEAQSPLISSWYRRIALSAEIDPVTALCDDVASGRTMNLAAAPPSVFLDVLAGGAVAEQQAVLGLIARRFHPDYLPALSAALKSPEPVVRVQAAAVVARIRDELAARVRDHLEVLGTAAANGGATIADGAARRAELGKAARSGLLDEGDLRRIEEALAGGGGRSGHDGPGGAATSEQDLLGRGDFRAFRVARRLSRIGDAGAYRIRRRRSDRREAGP